MATKKSGTKKSTAKKSRPKKNVRSVAQLLVARQRALLESWLANIKSLGGTRTMDLMTERQLRAQARDLLGRLTTAFAAEQYEDIESPEYAGVTAMLREISAARVEHGFSPSETATFVLSLKDVLLEYLQAELGGDPVLLNAEIVKTNKVIDKLALVTFEAYTKAREDLILKQSSAIMELTTPVIALWEDIVLLPLVGVVDTSRAQQIVEMLLPAIVEAEARVAVIDVTGVPVIDTRVAHHLLKTVNAVGLLGARAVVTGISPEAAQTLCRLDVDLSPLNPCGTLRAGVAQALRLTGRQVTAV